ncbi:MAG: GspE/PulE family protein [Planctomycetota bacterium]
MTELSKRCLAAAAAAPDGPTAAAADELLAAAAAWGASDVHVSPEPSEFRVRFRLDGVLSEVARLPRERLPLLVQRIKVLAGLLTYRSDRPQDGRIGAEASPAGTEVRVAVLPTLHGEKAVLRLLGTSGPRGLDELGWPRDAAAALGAALARPQGLLVFAGPAGSGKTTSIYAALRALAAAGQRACVTIEDPVEAALEGVDQTAVDRGAGLDFAAALRALLRHDPEVLFVGEVRDTETARTAVEAGLTGHLVLTTLHAGSACEALLRVRDLGVEAYALAAAAAAVFAQRLVRRSCAECGAAGCALCRETGYRGRVPLVEHLAPTGALRDALLAGAGLSALEERARETGRLDLAAQGRALLAAGGTTAAELRRCLGGAASLDHVELPGPGQAAPGQPASEGVSPGRARA